MSNFVIVAHALLWVFAGIGALCVASLVIVAAMVRREERAA